MEDGLPAKKENNLINNDKNIIDSQDDNQESRR